MWMARRGRVPMAKETSTRLSRSELKPNPGHHLHHRSTSKLNPSHHLHHRSMTSPTSSAPRPLRLCSDHLHTVRPLFLVPTNVWLGMLSDNNLSDNWEFSNWTSQIVHMHLSAVNICWYLTWHVIEHGKTNDFVASKSSTPMGLKLSINYILWCNTKHIFTKKASADNICNFLTDCYRFVTPEVCMIIKQ